MVGGIGFILVNLAQDDDFTVAGATRKVVLFCQIQYRDFTIFLRGVDLLQVSAVLLTIAIAMGVLLGMRTRQY